MTFAPQTKTPKVLVIDVGGTHVKGLASGELEEREIPSSLTMTASKMVRDVKRTDAIHGDNMLFVRVDIVEAAWSIVEPMLGNVAPLRDYDPGTWGPAEADQLDADVGGAGTTQKWLGR